MRRRERIRAGRWRSSLAACLAVLLIACGGSSGGSGGGQADATSGADGDSTSITASGTATVVIDGEPTVAAAVPSPATSLESSRPVNVDATLGTDGADEGASSEQAALPAVTLTPEGMPVDTGSRAIAFAIELVAVDVRREHDGTPVDVALDGLSSGPLELAIEP